MTPIVLSVVVAVVLFFVLAVFTRGGAGETVHPRKALTPIVAGETARMAQSFLQRLGFRIGNVEAPSHGHTDFVAEDSRPIGGQRLYVRVFDGDDVVSAVEVQSAMDRIKDGFHKAVLISAAGFSDEAQSAASETAVELIDGDRLLELNSAPPQLHLGQDPEPVRL